MHTDLSKVTIFISDESTNHVVKDWLREQNDITLIDNQVKLGVAGNSNRLLKCLSRFKYKILLNDDVEILNDGWEKFYFDAMIRTGMHHFCYRQAGVYGANLADAKRMRVNDTIVNKIDKKPHGAVMAFDQLCFEKVGYFDEGFNPYGMEHVDWSNRIHYAGLQPSGYYDVNGSERFFKIHHERSASEDRSAMLAKSNGIFKTVSADRNRIYIDSNVMVPSMSVIVPFRGIDRAKAIRTVVENLRCQLFPVLEILVIEQDEISRLNPADIYPAKLMHCPNNPGRQFCKSAAFNMGVMNASHDLLILHDADMVVQINYAKLIYDKLQKSEACHIGKDVAYFDHMTTETIYNRGMSFNNIDDVVCERTVNYFEGGSLALHKGTYLRIGGFNEDFIGYGCEDCEFFRRLKSQSKFDDERTVTLFHLWHGRTAGWDGCHKTNKRKWTAFESKPMVERISQLTNQLSKWKGKVAPLECVTNFDSINMQELKVGGVLCCGPDGGAFKYYTDGIGNAFKELGIRFHQWDGKDESIIKELQPRLYIACSEAWQHNYPEWARKEYDTKVIIHVNPYGITKIGSVDGGPVIDAKDKDIKWVISQKPHSVFCYAMNETIDNYYNYWQNRHGFKTYAMPLAADHVLYGMGSDVERFKFDVGWIGGMWPYKQKMMDVYLNPLRNKYKCGFYGWNNAWGMGTISNDDSKHLFKSCKICPSVSESHSVQHPIDIPERVYKVPCAGGFTIHTPTKAIASMGLSDVIPVAADANDWFQMIHHYMTNDDERIDLALKQRSAILGGHTYLHRITNLINEFYPEMINVLDEKKSLLING
jgi:GT2 family glycosyltransferase